MATKTKIKKPVAKKVVTEKKFTKSVEVIDWTKVPHGTYFKALFHGRPTMGRIKKANNAIYLCQNNDGIRSNATFKLKFSRYLCGVRDLMYNEGYFKNIELLSKKPDNFSDFEIETMQIAGRLTNIYKGHITVGCQKILNSTVRTLASKLKD